MRKVLFLDIDGVLNTKWWEHKKPKDQFGSAFDPMACANLAKIVKETGAVIVISSSWKCWGLDALKEMWRDRKMPGRLLDITPNGVSNKMFLDDNSLKLSQMYVRGVEIKQWLMIGNNIAVGTK